MSFLNTKSLWSTALLASGLALSVGAPLYAQTIIGVGTGIVPKYEGSKKYKGQVFPLLTHEGDGFFIAPRADMPAVGVKTQLSENWQIGAFGAYAAGRKSRKDSHLYGMNNISQHAAAGLYSRLDVDDFTFDVVYFHALKDGYGGGLQVGGAYKLWQTPESSLRIGSNLSWADSDAMDTNFGVSQNESAASKGRLNSYKASSGLRSYSLYGVYSRHFGQSWIAHSSLGIKSLLGDARDSPIVQRKASVFGSVGIGYVF